jgi:hypothetical protein
MHELNDRENVSLIKEHEDRVRTYFKYTIVKNGVAESRLPVNADKGATIGPGKSKTQRFAPFSVSGKHLITESNCKSN